MAWLIDLFSSGSVPGSILILALCSSLGLLLGSVRVRGIDLGIVGVLFAGLLLGHLGAVVSPELLEFVRDFGLILFVYAIGVQVGPGFMSSLRQRGTALNIIAASTVLLGSLLAVAISLAARIEVPVAVGMLAGATTNTPSLGAAQTALRDLPSYTELMGQLPGLGYAVAYPFGILGVMLAMVVLRPLFRAGNPGTLSEGTTPDSPHDTANGDESVIGNGDSLQVLPLFLGILLGVILGSIPVPVRGLPAPLRLGLAGGPLVVAIALSARPRLGALTWRLPSQTNALLREVGIVLFLACVGLMSGGRFVETLAEGDGFRWMAWATLITAVPVLLAGIATRMLAKGNYATTCGVLAGSMTDPPALAFATASTRSEETTMAYATVYPLTMVLRILSTQVMVLVMMR